MDGHESRSQRYWKDRLRLTVALLAVWFLAGPVLGILFIRPLNSVDAWGLPLGFWIAQQGAIYVFIVLIFIYAALADRADRRAGLGVEDPGRSGVAH